MLELFRDIGINFGSKVKLWEENEKLTDLLEELLLENQALNTKNVDLVSSNDYASSESHKNFVKIHRLERELDELKTKVREQNSADVVYEGIKEVFKLDKNKDEESNTALLYTVAQKLGFGHYGRFPTNKRFEEMNRINQAAHLAAFEHTRDCWGVINNGCN